MKHDLNMIKGSFYQNALDFVQKASVCENINNIRFFLESAYSNFSQSVLLHEGASGKLLDACASAGIKESIADSVKLKGSNAISRYYNNIVEGVKDRSSSSDKGNAQQYEKELEVLEMSHIGKAMCEYNMQEYGQCINSIDKAIGAHMEPWLRTVNMTSGFLSVGNTGLMMNSFFMELLASPIEECMNYFTIQHIVSSNAEVSLDNMANRNTIIRLLQVNSGIGVLDYLLQTIKNPKEIIN